MFISAIFAETILIENSRLLDNSEIPLREGPAFWHKQIRLIGYMPKLDYLNEDNYDYYNGQWIKVQYDGTLGYISKKSIQRKNYKDDIFRSLTNRTRFVSANQSDSFVARGMGFVFCKELNCSNSFFTQQKNFSFDSEEFKLFKKNTYKGFSLKRNYKKISVPQPKRKEYFYISEIALGFAIASALSEQGVYENKELSKYLNFIGFQIIEAFELTDINFQFYILDDERPNAYAIPAGVIFITKGMINLCDNEAELAVILAHEIAHVVGNHSMQEVHEQRILALAQADTIKHSQDNWEQEFVDAHKKLVEDEKGAALTIYETIRDGNLDPYEKEADEVGMTIAARAGYDVTVLPGLLAKIAQHSVKSGNQHYRDDMVIQRKEWASEFIQKTSFPKKLFIKEKRFRGIVKK